MQMKHYNNQGGGSKPKPKDPVPPDPTHPQQ